MSTPPDMVKIVNTSDNPFTGRYRHQLVEIPANSEVYMEGGIAHIWLGDPASYNRGGNRERTDEFMRVKTLWAGTVSLDRIYDPDIWNVIKPPLEVYTVAGERYYTLSDDPDGLGIESKVVADPENLADAIEVLKKQIARLEARQAKADELPDELPEDEEPPSDTPTKSAVRSAEAAKGARPTPTVPEKDVAPRRQASPAHPSHAPTTDKPNQPKVS